MEYHETLGECGTKNAEEIERKVSSHGKRLEDEYGLKYLVTNKDTRSNSRYYKNLSRMAFNAWNFISIGLHLIEVGSI